MKTATRKKTKYVFVRLDSESEEGSVTVRLTLKQAQRAKKLLNEATQAGNDEWPEEVNRIIDRAKALQIHGTINSCGDGWGWYENEETANEWPHR